MAACKEYEALLFDRAAGALDPAGEERLAAHLAACAGCRAEAAGVAALLSGAKLPAETPRDTALRAALPETALAAWRQAERSRTVARYGLGAVAAAALVAVSVSFGARMRPAHRPARPPAPVAALAGDGAPAADDASADDAAPLDGDFPFVEDDAAPAASDDSTSTDEEMAYGAYGFEALAANPNDG